jgi:hypothetical protein
MIPPGYITLPESLDIIEACIDDDDLYVLQAPPIERPRRLAAINGLAEALSEDFCSVDAYVMRGGKRAPYQRMTCVSLSKTDGWFGSKVGASITRRPNACIKLGMSLRTTP